MNRKAPKPIYLVNENAKEMALKALQSTPADGKWKVAISGSQGKSARQLGLQWLWYGDVVKSGIGGLDESHKDSLHIKAKAMFCLPIQIRDDDMFASMFLDFTRRWKESGEWDDKFRWFCDNVVSTQALNQAQMAEFLTDFKNYYGYELGVELTDPDSRGWANLLEYQRQ